MTTRLMAPPQPQVRVHGAIRAGLIEYARAKVSAALRFAPRPVLFVRITLDQGAGAECRYTVRVHADVSGVDLHASATAATFAEAVDLVHRRLRTQLSRASRWR